MDSKVRVGNLIRHYREAAGLTQTELERAPGVQRAYISSIEGGRILILYPKTFSALQRVIKFPTWELLEAMGYPVEGRVEGIIPPLSTLLATLTEDQQMAVMGIVRATIRAGGDLGAGDIGSAAT